MAVHPVIIEFLAKGIPDVSRALRGVEQAAAAHERSQTKTSQRESQTRRKAADDEARMKIRAMMSADRWQRQAQDKAIREAERTARSRVKAEERAERDMVRSAERAANERLRVARRVDRELAQMQARRERENSRIVADAARQEAREGRLAARAANDNSRARERFVGGITGAAGRGIAAGVSRVAGKATETAGIVGQLGGGFSIADSVQRSVGLKGKLADIASRDVDISDPSKAQRKSTGMLEGRVRAVSSEFGLQADKGADALDKFASKTGDLQKGLDMLRGLGELSRAGAGDLDDLADAAGDIFNADKTQSAEQVLQKLRQFALQGQKGAVEMKDLASQMAKIGAAAGQFEGGADKNLLTMGALAQLARESGGASSAREATTAVSSLSNQFYKGARIGKMRELGVNPVTEAGTNRPVDEVLFDLMRGAEAKSRKGGHGLQDFGVLFGGGIADAQARKATKPLERAFMKAGGGEAGIAAAKKELAKFGAGGRDLKAEFASKAADRMQEDDAKIAKIREDFDRAVSGRVLPALMKLVPEFERLVPLLVDLNAKAIPVFVDLIKTVAAFAEKNKDIIESIAAHPIGAIMAMEVTKSIAAASLGEVVKKLLMSAFPGGGGGGAPPGGGGPGGGVVAPAVGVGLGAAWVISKAMLGYEGGKEQGQDIAAKVRAYQAGDHERGMSPEQAQASLDAAKGRLAKHGGVLEQTANILTSPVVDASDRDYKQYKADQGLTDSEDLRKALAEATRAMRENTQATKASGGAPGAPPPGNSGAAGAARSQSFLERP